jgi:nucleoid DNA-binding protein
MIKADIVRRLAKHLNLKDKDALFVVDHILESMRQVIAERGRLEIRDFGVFQVKERKPRIGRNPKDKKEYPIPPRKVVTFKPGKELKSKSVLDSPDTSAPPPSPHPVPTSSDTGV